MADFWVVGPIAWDRVLSEISSTMATVDASTMYSAGSTG